MVYQEIDKRISGSNKSQKLGINIHPINTPSPYKHKNKGGVPFGHSKMDV